ncbi:hypothetical protein CTAYLR_003934 [Chrysophaeum taylorii]|uniref:Uncharacterized protein n=1 Tax=Chrysophaeum taylorii TaxID=2483200 RepID=A0AAD7XLS6_9STRA|nr:hypothetical protein CTAYLR_003934 [Chrysophaeum taylorii]
MRSEMKAAGLKIMTERKSDQELAEERITLKESEVNVQNAELNAKNHVFVTDGRIKDKRDMIGKGSETLFDFEVGDTSSSDYRKEGNIEFYTRANLHKRKAISRDRVVKKWLSIFWNTFSSVQSTGRVHHAEYVQVHMSIGKALFDPEEWDEEEVRETVELDWVRENGTSDTMDQAKFARSLFELVDTWAATIRLVEYRMFLQKLYFRITGSSTDAAMRERHAQRLRELERQQCKLRLSMKKYVERINSLTALAREIALKAKKVRDEKIKAINAAKQCELEEKECKERTAILECIRMEKDATKRAQLVSEARRRYSDDESFADAASHDEIGIGTLIAAEQEKLAATEAKRQRIEATHRKLSEVEATFIQREKELLEERSSCEDQMKSAEERMKAIEKESNEISNLAMGRRTWAPLDQIMSLRGHSEASMLSAMRKDRDFASFCQDNRLELQENIPSPDDIEVDLRRFSYLDDDDDDDDSEGLDDIDVYDMRLQKVTRQHYQTARRFHDLA